MTSKEIMGEIRREMEVREVKLSRIIELMDCSQSTAYRRWKNPKLLTVDDLLRICSYLNMKIKFEQGG